MAAGRLNGNETQYRKAAGTTVTIAEGFPCIDLYARPRKTRQKYERLSRLENTWIGGALLIALIVAGVVLQQQVDLAARSSMIVREVGVLETQKSDFESTRSVLAQRVEKSRGLEGSLAVRSGWLRLLQAISSVITEHEALEQCTMDGRTHRAVVLSGSAKDLTELQAMLTRLKALPCLRNVRLMETAADKILGVESIHFRIEARCDAADLNKETAAR